jgi:TolA-binding protein
MREQQAAAAAGDSGAVRDTAQAAVQAAVTEGPATLFSRATSLLQRGSTSTARRTFEDLLAQYPDSDLAPRSLLYIAEAFQADEDHGAADSVLNLVVERYPRSPEAPTALYKRAGALEKAGQTQRALQLYDRVVNDYPESDVVTLAREAAARLRRE